MTGFNTQPPEGGCKTRWCLRQARLLFQHTAARRRLLLRSLVKNEIKTVSTHSRPKAAARKCMILHMLRLSFNTQPPEGGCNSAGKHGGAFARFNTQPPEGGCVYHITAFLSMQQFQHTAARRRLPGTDSAGTLQRPFQHTAARRRLLTNN